MLSGVAAFGAMTVVPAAAAVAASPCQQAPSPGVPIPPLAPRDPLISQLGLDQAWTQATGAGVVVGVVDTGVDPSSPKLAGAVATGRSYHVVDTSAVYASAAGGQIDCDGHGTQVAGIIAGRTAAGDDRVSGIAPAATVYPVAIQSEIAQAPSALIAAAIKDAADHASVVNLSFAQSTDSPDIRHAIEYAEHKNVVVVASAANETGQTASGPSYPAAYPGVLAVSSIGGAVTGNWIDLAAPGTSLTTVTRGGKGYVTVSGTSFATAIVSGVAALVRQRFPDLTAPQVIARLEATALPPGDGSRDDAEGYGVVDPFAALTALSTPAAGGASAPAGRVPVPALHGARHHGSNHTVLGVTAALGALAVLVALGTLSVRAGRRRGWYPGYRPPAAVDERVAEPQPAELG